MVDLRQGTFIRKLDQSGFLTEEDRETLRGLQLRTRDVDARQDLILEGDRPENVLVVLTGIACRYKISEGGRRQIMALLLPGDFCDLHVAILGHMDHCIGTLTPSVIAEMPRAIIDDLTANHIRITRALWWATLADEGISREWLVNMGRRPADQQTAHLFCELHRRLLTVGLAMPDGFEMPLRQVDLSDILGLSPVHVNRVLGELRAANLIALSRRKLVIPNLDRLQKFCGFNPNYLHLTPRIDR
ncbi:Crp/Fnr family transcriptional regulator [Lichenibacterium dinghuense]|uniref:Crp/Fnr family transcriptional regulator n=1 Tax=Lichenibacterium dinghuense TaxID=2895977 RepID=UPI001F2F3861|nr:Crp/Fnr family transcriptional regulator [Lichenibacterium sp. 6Y81]